MIPLQLGTGFIMIPDTPPGHWVPHGGATLIYKAIHEKALGFIDLTATPIGWALAQQVDHDGVFVVTFSGMCLVLARAKELVARLAEGS